MPSSLLSNPLAFLRPSGGAPSAPGPTAIGGSPAGPFAPGGGGDPRAAMLAQMIGAAQIAPQVLAQQRTEYFKRFIQNVVKILGELRRSKEIGPRSGIDIARAQTMLSAAIAKLDKEHPEEAEPVQSLLAQGMMNKAPMGGPAAPMNRLPITR